MKSIFTCANLAYLIPISVVIISYYVHTAIHNGINPNTIESVMKKFFTFKDMIQVLVYPIEAMTEIESIINGIEIISLTKNLHISLKEETIDTFNPSALSQEMIGLCVFNTHNDYNNTQQIEKSETTVYGIINGDFVVMTLYRDVSKTNDTDTYQSTLGVTVAWDVTVPDEIPTIQFISACKTIEWTLQYSSTNENFAYLQSPSPQSIFNGHKLQSLASDHILLQLFAEIKAGYPDAKIYQPKK